MKNNCFAALTCAVLLLFSCKGPDDIDPDRGRSYLHIISASENKDTFQLNFNYYNVSSIVIGTFYFNRNWPLEGYADLEEGGKGDEYGNGKLFLVGIKPPTMVGVPTDTVLQPRPFLLNRDEKSTLCFVDSAGEIGVAKFKDEYVIPDSGHCALRFINLNENFTAALSLVSTNNSNVNHSAVAFMNASGFAVVPSGVYDFSVNDDGGGPVGSASGISLGSKGVYSLYFTDRAGMPVLNRIIH